MWFRPGRNRAKGSLRIVVTRHPAGPTQRRSETLRPLDSILLITKVMSVANTLRFALAALFFAGAAGPVRALQLGETREQTVARHGPPSAEDRGKDVATYSWEGWSAELEYKVEAIQRLIYRRDAYLSESEVAALLHSNGGAGRWRETTPAGEAIRQWVRDDGAIANCLTIRPLMMTFEGGRARPAVVTTAALPTPTVVIPVRPPTAASTPAVDVPKAEPEPARPPARLSAPGALLRLKAEKVVADPAAPTVLPTPTAPVPQRPVAPVAPAPPPASAALQPPAAASAVRATNSPGLAFVLGSLVVLAAAAGGALYVFKTKTVRLVGEKTQARPSVARGPLPKATPVITPALAALRHDQPELLVGEIFRREGYTVELSAAVARDDGIDLTLRRDGETILVQCKHWGMARVTGKEVREFYGAMTTNAAPRGILVTTGSFTRDAHEFARGKDIDLMDRAALEKSTAAVTRTGENFCEITEWVEEFTAHARIFDPECPTCQGAMAIRHNPINGAAAWNCRQYPRCPGRREARLDLLTVAAGR